MLVYEEEIIIFLAVLGARGNVLPINKSIFRPPSVPTESERLVLARKVNIEKKVITY